MGRLPPINDTAHQVGQSLSVFKAGSTVPVKFQLSYAAGTAATPSYAPIWVAPQKGAATSSSVDESLYSTPADSGNVFRLAGGQWTYNWKTDLSMAGYYWRVGVRLDDGCTQYVTIGLR